MSSHADTIRRGLSEYDSEIDSVRKQHEALDALLAENQRLRDALERIREAADPHTAPQIADALELPRFLRWLNKRLAGDAE